MRARRLPALTLLLASALTVGQPAEPRLTLTVDGQPATAVLKIIAETWQRRLVGLEQVPPAPVTAVFQAATLDGALREVCGRLGFTYQLLDDRILLRPDVPAAGELPALDGLPASLVSEAARRVRVLAEAPTNLNRRWETGTWLRRQRPDWRAALARALPDLWLRRDDTPAGCLRGAEALLAVGEPLAARRLLPLARRDESLEAAARCLQAELELLQGNDTQALTEARLATERQPDLPRTAVLRARALLARGRTDQALAEIMAAEARWPDDPEVLATYGDLLRRTAKAPGQAARLFTQALTRQSDNPLALFGLAALSSLTGNLDDQPWREFLRREPFSPRADRVRLALAAVASVRLAERGGPAYDVTADGERLLYLMKFRNQLEITDTAGTGLANQVTAQDSEKANAALSPDEAWLAWTVAGAGGDRLYLQATAAPGSHRQVAVAEAGASFQRTTWSPDGHLLLFSEVRETKDGRQVRLRGYDRLADAECPPPERFRLPGLGDVVWTPDDQLVGVVTDGRQETIVLIEPTGEVSRLRPPETRRRYRLPTIDWTRTRVTYQLDGLLAAPTDGAFGGETPVMDGLVSNEAAIWLPGQNRFVLTVANAWPTLTELGGLFATHRLLVGVTPLLAAGPRPPLYTCRIQDLRGRLASGTLTATIVADDGNERWRLELPYRSDANGLARLEVQPAAPAGEHWLRLDLRHGDETDPPRWYRFTVTD